MLGAEEHDGVRIVFVLGVFRSGTSLLHRLLHAHPDVALMWEADALRFLARKTSPHWAARLDAWNGCLVRHQINADSLPVKCTREEAALALYRRFAGNHEIRVIGEKSPYYCDVVPRLARTFPMARFIILRREASAIVESVRKAGAGNRFFSKPWMPARVAMDAGRLRRDADWLQNRGHAVRVIPFTHLVSNPQEVCGMLFDWLGVRPDRLHDVGLMPDGLDNLLPKGDHHRKVFHPEVDAARAVAQETAHGTQARWGMHNHAAYQAILAMECAKRMFFRNAPLTLLRAHRRKHPL
jgi:hypothetical protein